MPFRPTQPKHYLMIVVGGLFILVIGVAVFFFLQNRRLTAADRETKQLVQEVSKIFELPDELPTIATVADKEKLADQTFFAKAENNDKVLIFTEAKRAILYRPKTHRVIEVAPFIAPPVTDATQTQAAPATSTAPSSSTSPLSQQTAGRTVTILNGTSITGLAKNVVPTVQATLPGSTIAGTLQAKKVDYKKTLVVDVKKNRTADADKLAKALGADLVQLPAGEDAPTTDFLVIVGSDKQ